MNDERVLNDEWTADVKGRMHRYRITNEELAEECVYGKNGERYTPQYLSTVLNGRKKLSESGLEHAKDIIYCALKKIEAEREQEVAENADKN